MKFFSYLIVLWAVLFVGGAEATDQEYFLLITGCGRSGTTYIAKVLNKCGLGIGHEYLKEDGTVSWVMAIEDSYGMNRPGAKGLHFQHTFHQVRHPLDVISSLHYNDMFASSWNLIYRYIPQIKQNEPSLVQCAKYWYYWNLKAEKKAEWRYRIEDINEVFEEMAKRLGKPLGKSALEKIPKDTNHWNKIPSKVTWADLRKALSKKDFINIQKMAKRYGYSIKD